jgi:hypothetical protein
MCSCHLLLEALLDILARKASQELFELMVLLQDLLIAFHSLIFINLLNKLMEVDHKFLETSLY